MDSSTVFVINGEKYDVIKRGLAQAKQVSAATRWLAKYGAPAFRSFSENSSENASGFEVLVSVLASLDEYALTELFELVFGCSKEVAQQDFDIMQLVDGAVAVYNNSPVLRKLVDRFFSAPPSEDGADTSFTQSDPPTGG